MSEAATIRKIRIVQTEDTRQVSREVDFYNLDAIIFVGCRVNSRQATQFRIWATQTLREFIIKGFVLDDVRLKQGQRFGKDYFDELLERIREIRASAVLAACRRKKNRTQMLTYFDLKLSKICVNLC